MQHIPAAFLVAALSASCIAAAAAPSKGSEPRPLELPITVGGPSVKVAPPQPGRTVHLSFRAKAGQRINIGLQGVRMSPASRSALVVSVRDARDELVTTETIHCLPANPPETDGNCDGEFSVAHDGRHVIEVDGPFSARASYSAQLSTPAATSLAPGQRHRVTLGRIGQDARFEVAPTAGADFSVSARSAGPGRAGFALKVFRLDGSTLAAVRGTSERAASVPLASDAGPFVVEVDPDHGGIGAFVVEVRAAAKVAVGGAPVPFSSDGADLARVGLEYRQGQPFTVAIDGLTHAPEVDSNSVLRILKADGSILAFNSCVTRPLHGTPPRPCKVLVNDVAAGMRYSIGVAAPMRANVSGKLVAAEVQTGKLERGVPLALAPMKPSQVAQYTFEATAGEPVAIELTGAAATPAGTSIRMAVRAQGEAFDNMQMLGGDSVRLRPFVARKSGTHTVTIDPGYGSLVSGRLSLVPEESAK